MTGTPGDDPFGTADIRAANLQAWLASPTRLREDANAEEDHAGGYYRDRAVIELAQNAADAAAAAGDQPGGLLLRLTRDDDGAVLTAANTGAPLTATGVQALASMRASAKSGGVGAGGPAGAAVVDGTTVSATGGKGLVGRFGVGFAAVRALSDELAVVSGAGTGTAASGVAFSAAATRAELERLAQERRGATTAIRQVLERPAAELPILRLPFPEPGPAAKHLRSQDLTVPPGYDTAVVVRLRGPAELRRVRELLDAVDDALLLALPALGEVTIEADGEVPRTLAGASQRWLSVHVAGRHGPAQLADRPYEERARPGWSVTCALPRPGPGEEPRLRDLVRQPHVVHAPTPTDEPWTLPALSLIHI